MPKKKKKERKQTEAFWNQGRSQKESISQRRGCQWTSLSGAPNEEATLTDGIKVIAEIAQPGCAEEEKRTGTSSRGTHTLSAAVMGIRERLAKDTEQLSAGT